MDHAKTNVKQTRGPDAADQTPADQTSKDKPAPSDKSGKQDAPNYKERTDKDQALPVDDVNSANDE